MPQTIVSNPEIMSGEPVFRGTRVPFKKLTDYLEHGHTLDEFLDLVAGVILQRPRHHERLARQVGALGPRLRLLRQLHAQLAQLLYQLFAVRVVEEVVDALRPLRPEASRLSG